MKKICLVLFAVAALLASCHKDDVRTPDTVVNTPGTRLYILNEGKSGDNRASLDYLNLATNSYVSDYFYSANAEKLGDVGNDILIYGSKMYIVVNNSAKIDVADVHTGKLLGSVAVINGRYLSSLNGKVYATAYNNAVYGSNTSVKGSVIQIDTTSLSITGSVEVGRQPEGIIAYNSKLYVANSGGYDASNYEKTVSVINPSSMTVTKNIDVAINLNSNKVDNEGYLYVGSTGNYGDIAAKVFVVNTNTEKVTDSLDIASSKFDIVNDTAYFISSTYDANWNTITSYIQYNCKSKTEISSSFISSSVSSSITTPYGIFVDGYSGNIYIADAKGYSVSGTVYQFSRSGALLNSYTAGNIPSRMAMLRD